MELNWSTFILEIINFLVLIWILRRLFYAPIQDAIQRRNKIIEDKLNTADTLNQEANKLKTQYENRLEDWSSEKASKSKSFQQNLDALKDKEMKNLDLAKKAELEKAKSRQAQMEQSIIEKNAAESLALSMKFLASLLKKFGDKNLESKIINEFILDLPRLSEDKLNLIKNNLKPDQELTILSAYPISEEQQQRLTQSLQTLLGKKIALKFDIDQNLIAGLSLQLGYTFLEANLRDELRFFAEVLSNAEKY